MDLNARYSFDAPVARVWDALMDAGTIAACLPGCKTLEPLGEDRYRIVLNAGTAESEFTLRQAMRTPAFWMLVLATTTRVGVFNSITVHFVPIMVWKGASEQHAAAMLAAMALMSLPSHLAIGWIADRVSKPLLMSACMLVGAVSIVFLAYGDDTWAPWIFILLITFVEAIAEDVPPERLKRFFLRKGKQYHIVKEVRELCLFSAHDLIRETVEGELAAADKRRLHERLAGLSLP